MKKLFVVLAIIASSCKSKEPAVPSTVEAIEQSVKQNEELLRMRNKNLEDSLSFYKQELAKAKQQTGKAKTSGTVTSGKIQVAKDKKDTVLLTKLCDELEQNFREYVSSAEHQAEVQGRLIEDFQSQVQTKSQELDIEKTKYQMLKEAFNKLQDDFNQAVKELSKSEKKNKFLSFVAKLTGGIAAALAAILFIF